ncbi:hypothetical protein BAUCODRAFT_460952 [Baudoinia panamericana UAMH 10762]|uniref:Type 1 phosphatases regulator n=1 Tax=Baudoinia panamericana (strain UAMH 10762) TaxID=717646 RepID=M2NEH9_BAUPA|nr:uncharacterized protein BAUCODRAFT_460952 [Baudoinia panamericana UAMH 10762]EMC97649.1 hypothetical protein BAUCODRAFT_460952 [Baudoinia panamericana UAMH 10762]
MAPLTRTTVRTSGTSGTAPTSGSHTILQTEPESSAPSATLRLRGEPQQSQHVRWAEEVVDNEGMGKKSSKVCCIYHKPHEPGASDSDDDSSSDESDGEPDLSRAQKAGGKKPARSHNHGNSAEGRGSGKKPSPNAYERQPKHTTKRSG